jgi:lipoyl(octanoyl) transferase
MVAPSIDLYTPGLVDYATAWRWQQHTAEAVGNGSPEALALLQHPPVYTFGRRIRPEHLLVSPDVLRQRGADVVETSRGGDLTFHGPGQLVGYPILNLRDRSLGPKDYVRLLEETLIRTLERFGVDGQRSPGRPGVWTDAGKIAAIGVRIERGVSLHGFALNVDVDLSWFDAIVPCGLADARIASMSQIIGPNPGVDAVAAVLAIEFGAALEPSAADPPDATNNESTGLMPVQGKALGSKADG